MKIYLKEHKRKMAILITLQIAVLVLTPLGGFLYYQLNMIVFFPYYILFLIVPFFLYFRSNLRKGVLSFSILLLAITNITVGIVNYILIRFLAEKQIVWQNPTKIPKDYNVRVNFFLYYIV